ncbi:MAG: T9SS type A sorting domain-containing protein, partial [Cyclobacteriaceae bacterium]
VNGNIELETGLGATSALDLYNGTGVNNNATLVLTGSESASYTNASPANVIPDLYRMEIDKGADTTTTFTISEDIVLNGVSTASPLPITFTSGKLILDNTDLDLELANGTDLIIPAGSGLDVVNGTVTTENALLILDGLLRVSGGTVDLNLTDIEYSNTGNAFIGVTAGTLEVGGQIRRNTTTTSGILKYRQTGGDVDITTDKASVTSRAAFEVLNDGSEFTLTGGTFNIERGVTGDANESLELDPETFDLSGSTITVYENLGASYGANFFNVKSAIALNNLTIANNIALPTVRLYVQPLTINTLTINTNQRFRANNLDLILTGDLINNGNYRNNSSNTTFRSSAAQSISGSGVFTLHDLTKEGNGTTTSSVSLVLGNDLRVSAGILDIGTNSISLKNDAYIESTLTNSSGNGLVFNGTSGQDLYGLANNLVSLGTITINNPTGVDIPDGNGYDFDITQELRLAGGVFNIGGSLVTMKEGSTITEVSTFNENNMVQTNSSFTDNGFVIEFFGIAADTTVFFPVGELKYTPVQFDIEGGATAGSIRVRPANERHPGIIDNAEPAGQTEIDDTQNSLQYYWVVQAENTTNVLGTATFFYDHADILAVQSDTSNFIPARLLSNGTTWDKFPPTFFKGGLQQFEVPLDIGAGVSATEITGDYTAGLGSTDGVNNDIEGAIPNELARYVSNFGGPGNYSDDANWIAVGSSPPLTSGIGPVGAQITVSNGDEITLNISNIRLFSSNIEEGGTIVVPSGVTNVRLGTVTGSGTIRLTNTELLPTGEYTDFLACDGGALQYDGSTDFSVLSGISQIRKVVLSGSGIRTMPNNVLNVCDTLLINGPTVAFNRGLEFTIGDEDTDRLEIQAGSVTISNGTVVEINGDMIVSGGTLTGSNGTSLEITDDIEYTGGTIDFNNTDVFLIGTTEQLIAGDFTDGSAFGNLTINNSSTEGVTITSGNVEIEGIITFTDGLFNTTSSRNLIIASSGDWTDASTASYVTGPMRKENIAVASTYQFPVGKSVRYAPAYVANIGSGGQNWTAEYFTSTGIYSETSFDDADPGSGFNALSDIISQDRWEITSSGSNAAQIRLTYGTHHTIESLEDLRVVWWNSSDSEWENQGGTVTGNMSGGTVISENSIGFSTQQFALGQAPEEPLPVEMLYFNARSEEDDVILDWATASEINNDRFEVERSFDGVNFEKIGEVTGNGTITTTMLYSFVDELPGQGLNYYRLKQVDYDGAFEYSEIVFADYSNTEIVFEAVAYPNPANGEAISVKLRTGDLLAPVGVELIDLNGRVFYRNAASAEELSNGLQLNVEDLARGIYILSIRQKNDAQQIRLMVR